MKKKLPAFMFYPGDWLKDNSLRVCSLQSRGLWIDLLCYMHESPQRGVLMITEDKPMGIPHIAQLVGHPVDVVSELLGELVSNGVIDFDISADKNGEEIAVYSSRRMVRDEHKRDLCGKAGIRTGRRSKVTINRIQSLHIHLHLHLHLHLQLQRHHSKTWDQARDISRR